MTEFKFTVLIMMLVLRTANSLKTTQIQTATNFPIANRLEVLSRKRRFLVPQTSGWTFSVTFNLAFPIEGLGSSVSIDLPITYTFDDGR